MNKGLTGILRPNGEFLKCDYGNHCFIAKTIPKEEEMDCIYFSSNVENIKSSLLFFNKNPTKEQYLFIVKNLNNFDETQYCLWVDYVRKEKG